MTGVGDGGPPGQRVGAFIDLIAGEINPAGGAVGAAVGQGEHHVELGDVGLEFEGVGVGEGEVDIHGVLRDQGGQRAGGGANDIARRDGGGADEPADGRGDGGVAKIDLGRLHLGLGGQHGGLVALVSGQGLVERGLGAGGGMEQRLGAGQGHLGELFLRLGLGQGGLGLGQGGLIGRALDFVERLALGDVGAVGEVLGFEIASHARLDLHHARGRDVACVAGLVAHRLESHDDVAGLGGGGCLGQGGSGQQGQDGDGRKAFHAMVLTFSAS